MSAMKMFVSIQESFMPEGIDVVDPDTGKGRFSNETLEEIKLRYPHAVSMDLEEFHELRESSAKTEPEKISEENFFNAFECLPPLGYTNRGVTESFKMVERYVGRITSVYARLDTTYWTFRDVDTISHQEILERIAAAEEKNESSTSA